MKSNTLIRPDRKRALSPPFAWIDRRFLFDGFLAALSPRENLLYFFLVLVADRDGVSFYSYDKICTLLQLDVDAYVQARDGLLQKQLIAFVGQRFQVLALPQSRVPRSPYGSGAESRAAASPSRAASASPEVQALREIFTHLMPTSASSSALGPAPEQNAERVRRC